MSAWIGLAGVVAGALIALLSQHLLRLLAVRDRENDLLLEQLATVLALEEDFRNRVWLEREELSDDAVAGWDLAASLLAAARLRILCPDGDLIMALDSLKEAGKELAMSRTFAPQDKQRIQAAWEAHRSALDQFVDVSSRMMRRGQTSRRRRSLPPWREPQRD
jgi:hypothetical protein